MNTRVPEHIYAWLKNKAAADRRSLNSLVNIWLEDKYDEELMKVEIK